MKAKEGVCKNYIQLSSFLVTKVFSFPLHFTGTFHCLHAVIVSLELWLILYLQGFLFSNCLK